MAEFNYQNENIIHHTYFDRFEMSNCRVWHDDFLKNCSYQKLFILTSHRERVIVRTFSHKCDLTKNGNL